jgi:hypothetical protein
LIDQLVSTNTLKKYITTVLQPSYAARYHQLKSAIQSYLVPLGFSIPAISSPLSSNSNPTSTSTSHSTDDAVVGGYFIWLHLPQSIRASELAQRAEEEENVSIGSGALFQVVGDPLEFEGWIRLSFAWEEIEKLEEGIRRLARVAVRLSVGNE